MCFIIFLISRGTRNLILCFLSFKSLFFWGKGRKTQWNGTYRRIMDIGAGYGVLDAPERLYKNFLRVRVRFGGRSGAWGGGSYLNIDFCTKVCTELKILDISCVAIWT